MRFFCCLIILFHLLLPSAVNAGPSQENWYLLPGIGERDTFPYGIHLNWPIAVTKEGWPKIKVRISEMELKPNSFDFNSKITAEGEVLVICHRDVPTIVVISATGTYRPIGNWIEPSLENLAKPASEKILQAFLGNDWWSDNGCELQEKMAKIVQSQQRTQQWMRESFPMLGRDTATDAKESNKDGQKPERNRSTEIGFGRNICEDPNSADMFSMEKRPFNYESLFPRISEISKNKLIDSKLYPKKQVQVLGFPLKYVHIYARHNANSFEIKLSHFLDAKMKNVQRALLLRPKWKYKKFIETTIPPTLPNAFNPRQITTSIRISAKDYPAVLTLEELTPQGTILTCRSVFDLK